MSGGDSPANARVRLRHVLAGETLGREGTQALFLEVLDGGVEPALLGGLLVGLAQRGESPEEVAGLVLALRSTMRRFQHDEGSAIDTCGTGGDGLGMFNVSTAAAFVAAGAGAKVIKHGNRSVSSKSGSADLLEALGGRLEVPDEAARSALSEHGFTFLFAPSFHPAMRHVGGVRRALGIRTIFNLVGPLVNPGSVRRQVVGVSSKALVPLVADALSALGCERGFVVHGAGGADELTLAGPNLVQAVGSAPVATGEATGLGLAAAGIEALAGGDAAANARLMHGLIAGQAGPLRDAVILNAAAALVVADVAADFPEGVARCRESIDSGRAKAVLDGWVKVTAGAAAAKEGAA